MKKFITLLIIILLFGCTSNSSKIKGTWIDQYNAKYSFLEDGLIITEKQASETSYFHDDNLLITNYHHVTTSHTETERGKWTIDGDILKMLYENKTENDNYKIIFLNSNEINLIENNSDSDTLKLTRYSK